MLYDWQGNPIRNGNEFCIVRISPCYRLRFTGMMWLHTGWEKKIEPVKDYWEPGPYYLVSCEYFSYERHDDNITTHIDTLNRDLYKDDRYIIAIKGISDIKELYYANNNKV
jgi:hypothetical protein